MYKIIGIIGEAGSGKDTVMNKVVYEAGPAPTSIFHVPISCTTRPPRDYEKNGKDYLFLTNEDFAEYVLENKFLEVSEFNGWFYGTLKSQLSEDKINIAVLNPQGVESMSLHNDIKLKIFYLDVPGKIRLIRQLQREENPDISEIYRRYMADDEDFFDLPFEYERLPNKDNYDYKYSVERILEFARSWTENDKKFN